MYFLKRKICPSGPAQFKPALFKGQPDFDFTVIISSSEEQGNKSCPLNKTKPARRSRSVLSGTERSPARLQPPPCTVGHTERAVVGGASSPLRATSSKGRRTPAHSPHREMHMSPCSLSSQLQKRPHSCSELHHISSRVKGGETHNS